MPTWQEGTGGEEKKDSTKDHVSQNGSVFHGLEKKAWKAHEASLYSTLLTALEIFPPNSSYISRKTYTNDFL